MAEAVNKQTPQDQETAAVAKSAGRALLTQNVASPLELFDKFASTVDLAQMVADSNATRSDLRLILESDDEVAQCLDTRLDKLLGVDWRLSGGSEYARAFVTEQVKQHYDTLIENSFMARWYGYDVMERVYAKSGGFWYVKDLLPRPFEWFSVKRDRSLWYQPAYGVTQYGNNVYALRPDGMNVDTHLKFLLTLHRPTFYNPRGKAQAVYLFWPWFYRKCNWQFWMQFLERNGQPLLVGKSANPTQMASELAKAVQDAVIAVGPNDDVAAVSPNNKGEAFVLAEDRLVRRIQKIILGQTLTSDVGGNGTGSRALGEVHNEVRGDKTMSDLKLVRPTVQNYIDALVALNFPRSTKIEMVYAVDRGLEAARANRDANLMNTNQVEFTEQYFIREYGFQPGDIKVIGAAEKAKLAAKNKPAPAKEQQPAAADTNTEKDDEDDDDA